MKTGTPEWLVERLHHGDLPPADAAAVRARLEAEGGLARLQALAQDDARFAEAHPAGPSLAALRRRTAGAGRARGLPRRLLVLLPVAAAAAAAIVAVRLPGPGGPEGDVRLKGSAPHLVVHRHVPGGGPEPLASGARVRAGDVLQLSVVSAGRPYGVVVSVDGRGLVTRHAPRDGDLATELPPDGAVPLDHSYRLDDAPAFERFFLVTGGTRFPVAPIVEALRRLAAEGAARAGTPAFPAELTASDLVLEKTP